MASPTREDSSGDFVANLGKIYGYYTGGFFAFVLLLAVLEQIGVPNYIIGYLFVFLTLAVYAVIGIIAGEFILSGVGLGHQLGYAYNNFDNGRMYALMLLICALVVAVNGVLRFVDNALARRWGRLP